MRKNQVTYYAEQQENLQVSDDCLVTIIFNPKPENAYSLNIPTSGFFKVDGGKLVPLQPWEKFLFKINARRLVSPWNIVTNLHWLLNITIGFFKFLYDRARNI